ncbi:MAG: hypothetical protein HY703_14025 [Gemmatimonadetes bacterium]|nr:hypothetical protein [Gemmatimonadota bacterium]
MAGLDFRRATDLFLGTEGELALALGLSPADIQQYRKSPGRVTPEVLMLLGQVLVERGRGMVRVGELLQEQGPGPAGVRPSGGPSVH